MNTRALGSVLGHLRAVLAPEGGLSDGQLLQRFVTRRDHAAFASLVRRHGPMVLGVCRRVLRNAHDAEDAFQATFLVLVSRARSLTGRGVVGDWLHGVAYRTALKARVRDARRRAKERAMPRHEAFEDCLRPEWHALLDRELNGLPEKYRRLIVLCDLEGKTRREAARLLRCPEGTVSGRLSRARALLARRLTRQGLTLSGGMLAAALSQGCAGGVPASLAKETIGAALALAAGKAAAAGVVAPQVAALSEGVLKAMLLTKLRTVTAVLLAVGLLGLGAAGVYSTRADEAGTSAARTEPAAGKSRAGAPDPEAKAAERLPTEPLPRPAYVRLSAEPIEQIEVSQPETTSEVRESRDGRGNKTYFYEPAVRRITQRTALGNAQIFDMKGRKITGKKLRQFFDRPILALVLYADQRRADLRALSVYLGMFKEDTLLVVMPFAPPVPAAPALGPPPPAQASPAPPLIAPPTPASPAIAAPPPAPAAVPSTSRVWIDSNRFKLPYALSQPSASAVELWHLHNGEWKLLSTSRNGDAFEVEVAEQGVHGFSVIPRDKPGRLGPAMGELPQIWVNVTLDSTATLENPVRIGSPGRQILVIRWKVTLKDLAPRPIVLSYAASMEGPWSPLFPDKADPGVANTGEVRWHIPPEAPERLWIRLQIKNRDGRIGVTLLNGAVARPVQAGITGVERAGGN